MTKLEIAQFNEQYNLEDLNSKWFAFEDQAHKKSIELPGKPTKMWKDIIKRFFSNKWNTIAFVLLVLLLLLVLIGVLTAPYAQNQRVLADDIEGSQNIAWLKPSIHGNSGSEQNMLFLTYRDLAARYPDTYKLLGVVDAMNVRVWIKAPDALKNNILVGTDEKGYDIWSQIMHGAAFSLWLAFSVAIIETVVGVAIGVYIGFHAGKTLDTIMMRVIDAFSTIPSLILLIIFVGVMPKTLGTLILALLITGWIGPVYSSRIYIISIKDREFISASRLVGASRFRQIFIHALPNIAGRLSVQFVHRIPAVIFAEATLFFVLGNSFLPDRVSLGTIVEVSKSAIDLNIWYLLIPLFIMITLTVTLQIISNGVRDAMDPKVVA